MHASFYTRSGDLIIKYVVQYLSGQKEIHVGLHIKCNTYCTHYRTKVTYRAMEGAEPIYPDINSGECCPQSTECMWTQGVLGTCARYHEFTEPHIQRTGRCRERPNGAYEWTYRAIKVKVTKNCYCRFDRNVSF